MLSIPKTLRALAPRLALAAAYFLPTLLVVLRDPVPERILNMLAWSALGGLIFAMLPGRLFSVVLIVAWISAPVTMWWSGYAALNGMGPGFEALGAAIATNRGEAMEATRMILRSDGFVLVAVGHLVLLLIASVLWVRGGRLPDAAIADTTVKWMLLGTMAPLAVVACWQTFDRNAPAFVSHVDAMAFPLGSYVMLTQSAVDRAVFGWRDDSAARRPVTDTVKVTEPVLSIFVIGESVRAGGIGPGKASRGPWTKMLDDRFKRGLGTWLPDTCASAHGTQMAIPLLVTGHDADQAREAATAPSGLARLKAAGFATAWITNQDLSVFKEAGHDFTWVGPINYRYRYDEVLLPIAQTFAGPLLAANAAQERPRAILLHLMGSHFVYEDRYPGKLFAPEPAGLTSDELFELRYDRANEYGARTLVQIAELLDRTRVPAFAVFASDHGENMPSDRNGLLTHFGSRTSIRDGMTVSLVFWNQAMADTGVPQATLAKLVPAPVVAHKDIYRAWMAMSGIDRAVVEPTADPKILANVDVGSSYRPVSCSTLKP